MSSTERHLRRKARDRKEEADAQVNARVANIIQELRANDSYSPIREDWAYLAQVLKKGRLAPDPTQVKSMEEYFSHMVEMGRMTFETISEDQRIVFQTLRPTIREELRRKGIRFSRLFRAISDMHLDASKDVPSRERMRVQVDQNRFLSSGKEELLRDDMSKRYSVAANLMYQDGRIMEDVFRNIPASPVNWELADYVRTHNLGSIVKKLHVWACGIGNIYALSLSRSKTGPTVPGESAIQHAMQWLRDWTLGKPNSTSMIFVNRHGELDFRTGPILTALSERNESPLTGYRSEKNNNPRDGGRPVPKEYVGTDEGRFSNSIETTAKSVQGQYRNARVGIAQGEGHMYIVYLDMDGVWRSMDIYMDLADKPEGGVPNAPGYATVKLFHKVIVDSAR